mmetsp:Transcript_40528/g.67840  ORF Transcript_40528/g.67840 Transcript_40528/m.67840 type:complete len:139 (-) Transcript_40528:528-944(-)
MHWDSKCHSRAERFHHVGPLLLNFTTPDSINNRAPRLVTKNIPSRAPPPPLPHPSLRELPTEEEEIAGGGGGGGGGPKGLPPHSSVQGATSEVKYPHSTNKMSHWNDMKTLVLFTTVIYLDSNVPTRIVKDVDVNELI